MSPPPRTPTRNALMSAADHMLQPQAAMLDRFTYNDRVVRNFVIACVVWGIVGMAAGVFIALQLAGMGASWGPHWLNAEYTSFGRLRPLHTNAVIFAFTMNGIFAGVYYSIQRLLKARLWGGPLASIHFWLWQFIILLAAITLPMGLTTSKEYAELEWPIAILITVAWVIFAVVVFGTIYKRRESHLYVAIWFYIATIIGVAVLHIVNSLATPVDLTKSYPLYAGVQDALVQWWYGHNAVAFVLTTPILGLMYYFLPKAAGRPIYSYRLSIIHYWSLIFIYLWAGPHHLLHTSLPQWAQTLGVTFSIMLWAPSWGGMINGLLTLRGAWDKVRSSPVLKFFVVAITFYGMATFEGPLLSLRSVNALAHNTDWVIGHVHSGALGWVGFMMFGMVYWIIPKLYKRELYSQALANFHFWIATLGIVLYAITMWITGVSQGAMWFQFDQDGYLVYRDWMDTIALSIPFYYVRTLGGALYLLGAVLCAYNIWRTMRAGSLVEDEAQAPPLRPEPPVTEQMQEAWSAPGPVKKVSALHGLIERWPFPFMVLTTIALLIGGAVEIVPNMIQGSLSPRIATVKPYTPLELVGRDIYIREGCVSCHTQMVRTLRAETERYGGGIMSVPSYTRAGEHIYDRPFLWGSKRTGPDLAREGIIRPDPVWHYRHMWNPAKTTSPGPLPEDAGFWDFAKVSIMPTYKNLYRNEVDFDSVQPRMRALSRTPLDTYTRREIVEAPAHAEAQARELAARLVAVLGTSEDQDYEDDPRFDEPPAPGDLENLHRLEIIALIAYLRRLGTDIVE
ncbi:MAG: cytochrome-c oxidase, cbb3-type subunit I [Planctomycetota bacterium]|nr:MAG: cytochrome-c oxidase, cbb3-type subunit I [Planctomycetota bacterium]